MAREAGDRPARPRQRTEKLRRRMTCWLPWICGYATPPDYFVRPPAACFHACRRHGFRAARRAASLGCHHGGSFEGSFGSRRKSHFAMLCFPECHLRLSPKLSISSARQMAGLEPLASERKCYSPASTCKAHTPCGMTVRHNPGRCVVRLFFSEGKGGCQEKKREDQGNQGFHEDQPIDPWGFAECHRRGWLGNFRLWISCLAGRGRTSEASFRR
jgi:hypothetical protein